MLEYGCGRLVLLLEDGELKWSSIITVTNILVTEIPEKYIYIPEKRKNNYFTEKYDSIFCHIEIPFDESSIVIEEKITFLKKVIQKHAHDYVEILKLCKKEKFLNSFLERMNKKVLLKMCSSHHSGEAELKVVAFSEGLSFISSIFSSDAYTYEEEEIGEYLYPIETEFFISVKHGVEIEGSPIRSLNDSEKDYLRKLIK